MQSNAPGRAEEAGMTHSTTDSTTVRLLRVHAVTFAGQAEISESNAQWRLGPLDSLVAYQVPIAVVFLYEARPSLVPTAVIDPDRLREGLARLLAYYPHLAGRLSVDPTTGVRVIDRFGSGAELCEAEVNEPLSSFRTDGAYTVLDLPGGGNNLLAPFDPSFDGVRDGPILTVQHTRFLCGGVAIGIRCSHVVTDGDGFFRMVGDLAKLCRRLDHADEQLGSDGLAGARSYLADYAQTAKTVDLEQAKSYQPSLFSIDDGSAPLIGTQPSIGPREFGPTRIVGRELRFSAVRLAEIRRDASDLNDSTSKRSTFIALSAFLYQTVHKARTILQRKDSTRYSMVSSDFLSPINLRHAKRLPGLPGNYFPNALLTHFTTVPPDELASAPLHQIARRLYDTLVTNAIIGHEAEQTCKWIAAQPNKNHIKLGFRPGPGSFMISQWNRFDMYGNDAAQFAEGHRPVLVAPPFTPISLVDGLGYILPAHPTQGGDVTGLVVYLSLMEPVWEALDKEGLLGL